MTAALVSSMAQMQRAAAGAAVQALDRMEAENRRLRETIEEQAEEIRQLRALLSPEKECPSEWNLVGAEKRFVIALSSREWMSNDALLEVIRFNPASDGGKLVKCCVVRVRRKLKPFGFTVETLHAQGYRLPEREKIAELLR